MTTIDVAALAVALSEARGGIPPGWTVQPRSEWETSRAHDAFRGEAERVAEAYDRVIEAVAEVLPA